MANIHFEVIFIFAFVCCSFLSAHIEEAVSIICNPEKYDNILLLVVKPCSTISAT